MAQQYIDRFGNAYYTIEGLKQLVLQQIYNLGWNLKGTFQGGGTVTAAGDLLQDTSSLIWYRWDDLASLPKTVPTGSIPASAGGTGKWQSVDVADVLRKDLAKPTGAGLIGTQYGADAQDYFSAYDLNTVTALMASSLPSQIKVVRTSGYYDIFGKSDIWVRSAETATASQNPLQLNKLAVTDANGSVWYLDISSGHIYIDSIGAKGDGTTDDWYHLELCFKNAEQGSNRVVKGNARQYFFSKPILMKTGRHLEFNAKFGLNLTYGGQLLSPTDAPNATTPAGVGFTSTFSDKKAQVVVAHTDNKYASYWSLKNFYMQNVSNAASDYGIYCPFANNFEIESVWFVGGMIGMDSRNIYAYSMMATYFSAPAGIMGTVGINVTPITNGLGSGTSGTCVGVGVTNYNYSWFINEMNYTTLTSCYSEGSLTRYAFSLSRCNGLNINTYGIENLTAVAGDGRLAAIVDSQISINGIQASFNINLSAATAISVSGNSQVTINDMFIAAVGTAYAPLVTDSTSRVRMFGFKYSGPTPLNNAIGA